MSWAAQSAAVAIWWRRDWGKKAIGVKIGNGTPLRLLRSHLPGSPGEAKDGDGEEWGDGDTPPSRFA